MIAAPIGGLHRIKRQLPDPAPLVSLLVPTRDQIDLLRVCLAGLLEGTDYPSLEVLVLDNGSSQPEKLWTILRRCSATREFG